MAAIPTEPPVLLIGATGFIGRHLVSEFKRSGLALRILVRPRSEARAPADCGVETLVAPLHDQNAMAHAVQGVRAVVYAAGSVRGRHLGDFSEANVAGVQQVLNALEKTGSDVPLLLMSSLAASQPNLSPYAESKRRAEVVLQQSRVPWTILRPPAVYGEGDVEMRPVLAMIKKGWILRPGPDTQRVALLHVSDLARAVLAWLAHWRDLVGGTFALDDGFRSQAGAPDTGYLWSDMASALQVGAREIAVPGWLLRAAGALNFRLAGLFGYAPMLSPGKVRELQHPRWVCDNAAFAGVTGWQPRVTLLEGAGYAG